MQKYLAVHVVVLAGLVVAVTLLVFTTRALTFRIDKLETARDRAAAAPQVPASQPTVQPRETNSPDDLKPTYVEGPASALRNPIPQADRPALPVEDTKLTPAQEEAVAKSVDRILNEKYGHLPKVHHPEDFEKTLEKELALSESQKIRIGEILKWKREEQRKVFQGEEGILSGKSLKKAMEIDTKSEELIKAELSATQQAKYDQLKKDGKLQQGVTVQIETDDGPEKN